MNGAWPYHLNAEIQGIVRVRKPMLIRAGYNYIQLDDSAVHLDKK